MLSDSKIIFQHNVIEKKLQNKPHLWKQRSEWQPFERGMNWKGIEEACLVLENFHVFTCNVVVTQD